MTAPVSLSVPQWSAMLHFGPREDDVALCMREVMPNTIASLVARGLIIETGREYHSDADDRVPYHRLTRHGAVLMEAHDHRRPSWGVTWKDYIRRHHPRKLPERAA